jgi:hypothetical protein
MPKIIRSPWGWNITIFRTKTFWFKFLWIFRGECTSLQYHNYRTELYIGTSGIKLIKPFDHHQYFGGMYFEIAWGLPMEEDIYRITDIYGRA